MLTTRPEHVVLVDSNDHVLGHMEKLAAHREGRLHRAFSIFIFNERGEVLLQRRAHSKYHSPGLWSNTCCGHPRPGEELARAARRRLKEEMGLDVTLTEVFSFQYRADLGGGLVENELDHVFLGVTDQHPAIDPTEVSEFRFATRAALMGEVNRMPSAFSAWLPLCLARAWDAHDQQVRA